MLEEFLRGFDTRVGIAALGASTSAIAVARQFLGDAPDFSVAPLLVLGAQTGLLFGTFCFHWFPNAAEHPNAFAVVGMAAFFTAVVRAPLTGMVLVTEMTASFTLLLPMLGSCFAAMAVPTLLGNAPIHDSLAKPVDGLDSDKKTVFRQ